jgi:hypothetical protein
MVTVDDVRARVTRLAARLGVLAEVHDLDAAPANISLGRPRIECIVIDASGDERTLQVSCDEFERAGEKVFDDFLETAARELGGRPG